MNASQQYLHAAGVFRKKRAGNRKRSALRVDWQTLKKFWNNKEFTRAYRIPREEFVILLQRLGSVNSRVWNPSRASILQAERSSGTHIPPEHKLAAVLRLLAGGSYIDIQVIHGMAKSTLYHTLDIFINDFLSLPHYRLNFPLGQTTADESLRQRISAGFAKLSRGVLRGCLGAVDGIVIKIKKPSKKDTPCPQEFWNRKGYYAFVLQAVCDADRIFRFGSCQAYGNTHDSLAFSISSLGKKLDSGEFPELYFIVGDEAYRASDYLLAPFSGRQLPRDKDTFNFFQSRMRINIECAFGLLVQRWGILWRPLRIKMRKVPRLLLCLLGLNNIATRCGLSARRMATKTAAAMRKSGATPFLEHTENYQCRGRRRDLERSTRRMLLTAALRNAGLARPARSRWGLNQ